MADTPMRDSDRLDTLLALREVGNLSLEEQAELDDLLINASDEDRYDNLAGRLLVALDEESADAETLPPSLAAAIVHKGQSAVGSRGGSLQNTPQVSHQQDVSRTSLRTLRRNWGLFAGWSVAAIIAIGAGVGLFNLTGQLNKERDESSKAIADARSQVDVNARIIEASRAREASIRAELTELQGELETAEIALADERSQRLELASQLADASAALDAAELHIAKLETPIDPAEIRENRTKLLEVPGTVRMAWQPFDLPDNPAEQQAVTGDVVWNDELEQGYLRFVGLAQNDPAVEQYQVWVIDERGLEQKVSGGVFNANAAGEIIVPIDPAIDVGQVALFAITIEEPGGTWVPDLARRVVVAQPAG
ncbi:MAG: hypothetical protein Phyf2KO_06970 [Phycisphaerales bacterium]